RTDPAELMNAHEAAERGKIVDHDMSRKLRIVGKGRVVADDAVVRDVRVREQPVTAADGGDAAILRRSRMNGHELADDVAVADGGPRGGTIVLAVLRDLADRRKLEDPVVATDRGARPDHHVSADDAAFADRDIVADDAIGSDLYPRRKIGT